MSNVTMWLGASDAKFLLECPKRLVEIGQWKRADNREGKTEKHIVEARVSTDGALPRGLWFRSIVFPRFPDVATFQLDCDKGGGRTHHTLYRLEWRPLTAHSNTFFGPAELHGLFVPVGQTHDHSCLDHVIESEDRIRAGDVQCARLIDPDFENFDEALAFFCDKLNIDNGGDLPKPTGQGALF